MSWFGAQAAMLFLVLDRRRSLRLRPSGSRPGRIIRSATVYIWGLTWFYIRLAKQKSEFSTLFRRTAAPARGADRELRSWNLRLDGSSTTRSLSLTTRWSPFSSDLTQYCLSPPLTGSRQTISYAPAKAAQEFSLARAIWPLLNLCETMENSLYVCMVTAAADDAARGTAHFSSGFHAGRLFDGNRMPELQRDFLLHDWQTRSPDQVLEKRILHIRHCRSSSYPHRRDRGGVWIDSDDDSST